MGTLEQGFEGIISPSLSKLCINLFEIDIDIHSGADVCTLLNK